MSAAELFRNYLFARNAIQQRNDDGIGSGKLLRKTNRAFQTGCLSRKNQQIRSRRVLGFHHPERAFLTIAGNTDRIEAPHPSGISDKEKVFIANSPADQMSVQDTEGTHPDNSNASNSLHGRIPELPGKPGTLFHLTVDLRAELPEFSNDPFALQALCFRRIAVNAECLCESLRLGLNLSHEIRRFFGLV